MSLYTLSRDAELDLEQIWDFIANDGIEAADRWIAKLFEAFKRLAVNPAWVIRAQT